MKTTTHAYTVVTHFYINNKEYVIVKGAFEGDTEGKYNYAGLKREWITDGKINRELNGAQMFIGETVKDTIDSITFRETIEHIAEAEGLSLMDATIKYFKEKANA